MTREERIEELDKENGKLEGKLADLQSEYIELENFHNNEVNELKAQIEELRQLLQDIIVSSGSDREELLKEAEQFLKEIKENDSNSST